MAINKKIIEKNLAALKNIDLGNIDELREAITNLNKQIDLIKTSRSEFLAKIATENIEIAAENIKIDCYQVWTDGACSRNPGVGGWAALIRSRQDNKQVSDTKISGSSLNATNNIMELTAAIEALQKIPKGAKVHLYTDSQYLKRGMTEWIAGWKKKNWKKTDGKPVLNQKLWIKLDQQKNKKNITWHWVKAHSKIVENELCDKLARQAIKKLSSSAITNQTSNITSSN